MYLIDLHIHTLASCHGYSSVYENIMFAKKRNMELIGITDHGPELDDSPHRWHFLNMNSIPEKFDNIIVLKGIESNIIDLDGNIDCDSDMFKALDYVMAGFHYPLFENAGVCRNTDTMIKVINNPFVSIISHPDNPKYPIDFDEVARAAYENNVALELNSGSPIARPGSHITCPNMLKAIKKYGGYISLGSDAHFCSRVGDLDYCESMIKQLNFNEDMVLNTNVSKVIDFFKYKKNKCL